MDTGENSSGDEYEDTAELLNDDDDDFLGMMDVPTSKRPQTLSKDMMEWVVNIFILTWTVFFVPFLFTLT